LLIQQLLEFVLETEWDEDLVLGLPVAYDGAAVVYVEAAVLLAMKQNQLVPYLATEFSSLIYRLILSILYDLCIYSLPVVLPN
jgi:hypothetical protein